MKKVFLVLLLTVSLVSLAACGGDKKPAAASAKIEGATNVTITVGDTFDPKAGVTATDSGDKDITADIKITGSVNTNTPAKYELVYSVTGSDGKKVEVKRTVTVTGTAVTAQKITIMHGAPYEIDPFHETYSGKNAKERQDIQNAVEAKYNVDIDYIAYPANAPWGPDRVQAIINASISGKPLADIYWSTSDWIQQLAKAEAIAPIDKYLDTTGSRIHSSYREIGSFQGQTYGFSEGNLTVDVGLYFNAALVKSLGVANPSQLFLDGEWTWTRFEQWATQVQTLMNAQGDGSYALGGQLSAYAESMIPLNGGSLINATTKRVAFAQNPALQTYDFLHNLYTKGVFEQTPAYDAGSPEWQAGKVVMHPGSLWFVTADNRWGGLPFELGFVPYPKADAYEGEYASPVSGVALFHVASGMTAEREALVFEVFNELQLWRTEAELKEEFELSLMTKFDDPLYVSAYLAIYDKTYLELINAVGIGAYGESGWRRNINVAIKEGNARTVVDSIKQAYDNALNTYLNS
jgi:maltose-binding protein MalE